MTVTIDDLIGWHNAKEAENNTILLTGLWWLKTDIKENGVPSRAPRLQSVLYVSKPLYEEMTIAKMGEFVNERMGLDLRQAYDPAYASDDGLIGIRERLEEE
jgi:hypothetical protein